LRQRLNTLQKDAPVLCSGGRYKFNSNRKGDTDCSGCPVPQTGTGRYKFNGNGKVKGAQLKLAATKSKP
jgi:hypothetical protein